MNDPRALRLFDLQPYEYVAVECRCGRIVHYKPGVLQRLKRVPSDTLIYDLQFRLRCAHCNARGGFKISIVDSRPGERAAEPRSSIVIVDTAGAE